MVYVNSSGCTGLMLVLLYGREGWFAPVIRATGFNIVFAFPGMHHIFLVSFASRLMSINSHLFQSNKFFYFFQLCLQRKLSIFYIYSCITWFDMDSCSQVFNVRKEYFRCIRLLVLCLKIPPEGIVAAEHWGWNRSCHVCLLCLHANACRADPGSCAKSCTCNQDFLDDRRYSRLMCMCMPSCACTCPLKIGGVTAGMALATLFVTLPFVVRELIPILEAMDMAEEEAARTLGASDWEVFWNVTLPNIRWGLLYGVILTNAVRASFCPWPCFRVRGFSSGFMVQGSGQTSLIMVLLSAILLGTKRAFPPAAASWVSVV